MGVSRFVCVWAGVVRGEEIADVLTASGVEAGKEADERVLVRYWQFFRRHVVDVGGVGAEEVFRFGSIRGFGGDEGEEERVKLFVCGARFIGICRSGRGRPRPFGL